MPQAKPGLASNILAPAPTGEGFVEIAQNKTLFVQKLTDKENYKTEIIEGLDTVEAVFDHFKPSCTVNLEKEDGATTKETFNFGGLGDFDEKKLVKQSAFLSNTNADHDAYLKIVKQLGTNRSLKNVIENPETKVAFINSLKALIAELD